MGIQHRFSSTNINIVQDESQMEEEARALPQAQEKKDESSFQINASHHNLTCTIFHDLRLPRPLRPLFSPDEGRPACSDINDTSHWTWAVGQDCYRWAEGQDGG